MLYCNEKKLIRVTYDILDKLDIKLPKLILGYNIQLYNRFENGLSIQRMTAFGSKYAMEETFDEMEGYWIDQN